MDSAPFKSFQSLASNGDYENYALVNIITSYVFFRRADLWLGDVAQIKARLDRFACVKLTRGRTYASYMDLSSFNNPFSW